MTDQAEQLARRVRRALGKYNDDARPVVELVGDIVAYWEGCQVEHNKRNIECQDLRAKLAAAEKDTARLDWLRDVAGIGGDNLDSTPGMLAWSILFDGPDIDDAEDLVRAAIDAAREE
jgi:hypothetical protein